MINNKLIYLPSLSFLSLFNDSAYGEEPIKSYWKNRNLMNETHWKSDKKEGLDKFWYKNG
jgi:antitoxin component YwqK of YwqJK toxin-antitoxin module